MGRIDGKVAIVTGGGSGIGRACSQTLAREGATVVVTDVVDADGQETVSNIEAAGGKAVFMHQDVVGEDRWREVVAQTVADHGGLHILVNNAGIGIGGPIWEFELEDWKKQIAINMDGVFLGTKHAIPAMRDCGGGSIIIISSLAGMQGSPGLAGYCATKGGVRLFAKACAVECARAGFKVRVNSVHPGIIETPIWTKMGGNVFGRDRPNAIDPTVLAQSSAPLGRAGRADDIANGVLFLASDESDYMTGGELVIDGGIFAG